MAGAEMKPYQRKEQIGDATLYCGDCLGILPQLGKVDAVVTDPPYGDAYKSGHATNALWGEDREIYGDQSSVVRDAALRAIDFRAALVFGKRTVPLPEGCRQILIWDKGGALGMGALDLPWKPAHEEIYVLGRGFVGGRNWHSVTYHPPVQSMAKNGRKHPTEKPLGLMKRLLKWCPHGLTLDPFMGSGTTGVACAALRRPFIGIEFKERYFDIACRRIKEAYRQPDLFIEPPAKPVQDNLL